MSEAWLTEEPKALLVVVEDSCGCQWYRWSAGVAHTGWPWAVLGAVHADTIGRSDYECFKWEQLPPVFMVSPGVSRDSYLATVQ